MSVSSEMPVAALKYNLAELKQEMFPHFLAAYDGVAVDPEAIEHLTEQSCRRAFERACDARVQRAGKISKIGLFAAASYAALSLAAGMDNGEIAGLSFVVGLFSVVSVVDSRHVIEIMQAMPRDQYTARWPHVLRPKVLRARAEGDYSVYVKAKREVMARIAHGQMAIDRHDLSAARRMGGLTQG